MTTTSEDQYLLKQQQARPADPAAPPAVGIPVAQDGQPMTQVALQTQILQQQLLLQQQMAMALSSMGGTLPSNISVGQQVDIAQSKYLLGITIAAFTMIGMSAIILVAFAASGLMRQPVVCTGPCICLFVAIIFLFLNKKSEVIFDKQRKVVVATEKRMLTACCGSRMEINFSTPVRVTLESTNVNVNGMPYCRVRMYAGDQSIDLQRAHMLELMGAELKWKSYLISLGMTVQ